MVTRTLLPTTTLLTTGATPAASPDAPPAALANDPFARRAGPDVSLDGACGRIDVYAVFSVDRESQQLRVAIVDGQGRLLRLVPPGSVSEMLSSMERYRPH